MLKKRTTLFQNWFTNNAKPGTIYMIPQPLGICFCMGIFLLMIIAAVDVSQDLYLFTMTMAVIGFASLFLSHQILQHRELIFPTTTHGYEHAPLPFEALLLQSADNDVAIIADVQLTIKKQPALLPSSETTPPTIRCRQQIALDTKAPQWQLPPLPMGVYWVEPAILSCEFPLGFVKTLVKMQTGCLLYVYPTPQQGDPMASPTPSQSSSFATEAFHRLRPHTPRDPMHHIHWKGFAKSQTLLTKVFEGEHEQSCELFFDPQQPKATQCRILAASMHSLLSQNIAYSLQLPHIKIQAGYSLTHFHQCMQELCRL